MAALALSACGDSVDDRPPTLPYITEAILVPACGKAECHSSFKREVGDTFDTVDETRRTLVFNQLVIADVDAGDPANSQLIKTLTVGVNSILYPGTLVRMPYDEPMPEPDIALIERWIAAKDAHGLGAPGAQCIANSAGHACFNGNVVGCTTDGNVTNLTPITMCSNTQFCDPAVGECVSSN